MNKAYAIAVGSIIRAPIAVTHGTWEQMVDGPPYVSYTVKKVIFNFNPDKYRDTDIRYLLTDTSRNTRMLDEQGVVVHLFDMNPNYVTRLEM